MSVIAHGRHADTTLATLIAYAAQCASETLDEARQRLASASIDELDAIGERLRTAGSLPEALGAD